MAETPRLCRIIRRHPYQFSSHKRVLTIGLPLLFLFLILSYVLSVSDFLLRSLCFLFSLTFSLFLILSYAVLGDAVTSCCASVSDVFSPNQFSGLLHPL